MLGMDELLTQIAVLGFARLEYDLDLTCGCKQTRLYLIQIPHGFGPHLWFHFTMRQSTVVVWR
jgi:hypothetical protein